MTSLTGFHNFLSTVTSVQNSTSKKGPLDIFANLAKSWNISIPTLVIIGSIFITIIGIIIGFIIYLYAKKSKHMKKTWINKKDAKVMLLDDDFAKYDSPYGYIDMTIMYIKKQKTLRIHNLTVGNICCINRDIPDCYIKAFLKDKHDKKIRVKKTKTIDNNLNPTFPEVFSFQIDDLEKATVYFQLFDENKNGNDYPMGDGQLNIHEIPQESFVGLFHTVYAVLDKPSEVLGCGDVCLILTYDIPKLNINVLEAKDLIYQYAQMDGKIIVKLPTVYAVVKIFVNGHKKKTFKTSSLENTRHPYFFESFGININTRDLLRAVIKVELYEFSLGKLPKRIGRACIGNKTLNPLINDLGQQHIELIAKHSKTPQAMWHALIKG